jgi:uncharacterized protein (TIGR02996 family)
MDDPADLLNYIRANLPALAERLVYADWLEEQGEAELAELARLGAQLHGLERADRPKALAERYRELMGRELAREPTPPSGLDAWGASLAWRCVGGWEYPGFGGLFDSLHVHGDAALRKFIPVGDDVVRRHPGLELVVGPHQYSHYQTWQTKPCSDEALGELLRAPCVARLRRLVFRSACAGSAFGDTARLARLLAEAQLSRLRMLHAAGWWDRDADAGAALLWASSLGELVELVLSEGEVGVLGLEALLGAKSLAGLRKLGLPGTVPWQGARCKPNVGKEGAIVLARHPGAARLRELDLSANELNDEAALALAGSPYLSKLARLTINDNSFSPEGSAALRAAFGERVEGLPS